MCGMIAGSLFNIVFDYFHFPVRTGHVRCGACDRLFAVCQHSGAADAPAETVPDGLPSRQTPLRVSRVPSLCAPGLSSLIGEMPPARLLLFDPVAAPQRQYRRGGLRRGGQSALGNRCLYRCAPAYSRWSAAARPVTGALGGLFRWGICTALGIAAVLCVSVFLGAEPLTAVFNRSMTRSLRLRGERPAIYFTGFLFAGVNMVTAAFFSASDKTVQGFVLSLLRGVIAVSPILFPLAWVLGVDGVWLTFPMVELVTAVAALVWARKYIIKN
ncbi:MAG: hypothetical protein ACLT4C_09285 [Butyricicoccus sp.]